MAERSVVARSLTLVLTSMLVTGCMKSYWTAKDPTLDKFTTDHRECLQASGIPVTSRPGYVVASEGDFRRCLIARGWFREQWRSFEVPPGRYRGIEDLEDDPRPVAITELPEQPPSASIDLKDPRYFIQPAIPAPR